MNAALCMRGHSGSSFVIYNSVGGILLLALNAAGLELSYLGLLHRVSSQGFDFVLHVFTFSKEGILSNTVPSFSCVAVSTFYFMAW